MSQLVKATFEDNYETIMKSPILFGDFMTSNPTD